MYGSDRDLINRKSEMEKLGRRTTQPTRGREVCMFLKVLEAVGCFWLVDSAYRHVPDMTYTENSPASHLAKDICLKVNVQDGNGFRRLFI